MVYLIFLCVIIRHVDTSRIEISHKYKKIQISNLNGNIGIEYIPSDTCLYLKIKKKAKGKIEKFKEWINEVKVIINEENDFCKIKVKYPEKFKGIKDESVDLTLILPYEMEYVEAKVLNGNIKIKDLVSQKYRIEVLNGDVEIKEISGEGKVEVNNGNINFTISHDKILDTKLEILNGDISISCPSFTQVFPEVINGKIEGDLTFEKLDIFQKIKCEVFNGDIRVKRRK